MLVWTCGGGIVVSREGGYIVCWCGRVEGELSFLERGVILCVGVVVWRGNCRV